MKNANRRFKDTLPRICGGIVQGPRLKSNPQAVNAALQRHIASQPYTHGGLVNEACPACREIRKAAK